MCLAISWQRPMRSWMHEIRLEQYRLQNTLFWYLDSETLLLKYSFLWFFLLQIRTVIFEMTKLLAVETTLLVILFVSGNRTFEGTNYIINILFLLSSCWNLLMIKAISSLLDSPAKSSSSEASSSFHTFEVLVVLLPNLSTPNSKL